MSLRDQQREKTDSQSRSLIINTKNDLDNLSDFCFKSALKRLFLIFTQVILKSKEYLIKLEVLMYFLNAKA